MLAGWAAAQNVSHQLGPDTVRLIPSIEGPALYRTYCAVCHGNSGTGGGPMAMSLRVQPSDLTRIAARNGGEFPLARVEKIIAGARKLQEGTARNPCHSGDRSFLRSLRIGTSGA